MMLIAQRPKAVPEHFAGLEDADAVRCQFVFVKLKLELCWVETAPIDHASF